MNATAINIISFVTSIAQREPYQSVVFLSSADRAFEDGGQSLIEGVAKATAIPFISLTHVSSINITDNFNIEILTIVDLQTKLYGNILVKLRRLFYLTGNARIILILDQNAPNPLLLLEIFEDFWRQKFLNVIAIFRDFERTQELYSFVPYPSMNLEKMSASEEVIFPDRLKDLKGSALSTFADQLVPTNMMTQKPNGGIELSGYAGHIINAFTRKHNAKLNFSIPYELGQSVYPPRLFSFLFNETIDLVVALSFINLSVAHHSYTVEQSHLCLMIPVEADIPTPRFYQIILRPSVICVIKLTAFILGVLLVVATYHQDRGKPIRICDIILEKTTVRGVLAQSFKFPSSSSPILMQICILISLLGMQLSTFYLAFLQSYFMHPPTQRRVDSFADLRWASFKVFFLYTEGYGFLDAMKERMDPSVLQVTRNFTELLAAMDSLNTSYAYVVPMGKWNILKGKQEWFARPLFRLSNMCAMVSMHMAFPMHPNSVFKDALNRVIAQVTDAGLLKHWVDRSFVEMVEIGRMTFSDWSSPRDTFTPLQAKDLTFVLVFVSWYFAAAVLVFIAELLVDKVSKVRERRRVE